MKKFPVYNLESFNVKLIAGAFLFLILSYILLLIGTKHNIEFLSLNIFPIMQIIGYITIIIAILRN